MDKTLKRTFAYFIDILVVTTITYLLSSTTIINPQLNNYNKYYKEYTT